MCWCLQALSYRQLAFVGDATLWMLFAEHAFDASGHQEDPIRQVALQVLCT
jgi:hypothetical protein